jgi:hypothetical protein
MPLTTSESLILVRANRTSLLSTLRGAWSRSPGAWLDAANPYTPRGARKLSNDIDQNTIDFLGAREYLASAAFVHCGDGWAYLGRALEAMQRGDDEVAIHLAYYSSLRAALGLLAAEGIAVMNGDHFVVDSTGACLPVPPIRPRRKSRPPQKRGTHQMVWLALEHWARTPNAAAAVGDVVQAAGLSLNQWLGSLPFGTSAPLAADWMTTWGVDLRRLSGDRTLRNTSSYEPTRIAPELRPALDETLTFVTDLWEIMEPYPLNTFEALDWHLVHAALDASASSSGVSTATAWRGVASSHMASLGLVNPALATLLGSDPASSEPAILRHARASSNSGSSRGMESVSRAALLLRVATGAVTHLASDSGGTGSTSSFWWRTVIADRGIWSGSAPAPTAGDLWADIRDAIASARSFRDSGPPVVEQYLDREAATAWTLGGAERVLAWSLVA